MTTDTDPDALIDRLAAKLAVPLLLTNEAAAAYVGLSVSAWARAKATGSTPKPRRVPGRSDPMYHRRDLDEFADKLEKAGSALPARRKS